MKSKSLLHQSANLLAYFNQRDQLCFTLKEAAFVLQAKQTNTPSKLLSRMVQRGLLIKIKHGVYYIIPYDQNPENFMPDWHLLAKHLVGEATYYIGYYSAMQIHSLITQPALKEQIVVDKQLKPSLIKIKNIPFQFIYHNKKHFFGNKKTWIDNFNKVECSDLEKTFIDALFKPEYSGGMTEIMKALYKSKEKIDFKKLYSYTKDFDSIAVSKRLGYLLEVLQLETSIIQQLQKLKARSTFILDPSLPKSGDILSRWNLQVNLDKQSLISSIFS